jgi:hypothetical protein
VKVELAELAVADPPERWADLGFAVSGSCLDLGGVRVRLGVAGEGIVSWTLRGVEAGEIDGLVTHAAGPRGVSASGPRHSPEDHIEFGASRTRNGPKDHIDHVVVLTPDFDRTAAALAAAGMPLRRVRDAGGLRQGFRRLGPAILELVESREAADGPGGRARFWGLAVVVGDLDALAARLGEHLGSVRDAVQPGRRIATLRPSAGLSPALAFMDPEP